MILFLLFPVFVNIVIISIVIVILIVMVINIIITICVIISSSNIFNIFFTNYHYHCYNYYYHCYDYYYYHFHYHYQYTIITITIIMIAIVVNHCNLVKLIVERKIFKNIRDRFFRNGEKFADIYHGEIIDRHVFGLANVGGKDCCSVIVLKCILHVCGK